jgi:hypothetical protein
MKTHHLRSVVPTLFFIQVIDQSFVSAYQEWPTSGSSGCKWGVALQCRTGREANRRASASFGAPSPPTVKT